MGSEKKNGRSYTLHHLLLAGGIFENHMFFSVLDLNLPWFSSTGQGPVTWPRCRSKTLEQLASLRCLGAKNMEELRWFPVLVPRGVGSSWKHHFSTKSTWLRWVFMKMGLFFAKWALGEDSRWMLDWTKCPGCYWNVPETKSITNLWKIVFVFTKFCILHHNS